jgi:hypothetical protein
MRNGIATGAVALWLAAGAAWAVDPIDGTAIRALVAGSTISGTMLDTGAYAEFYAENGEIRGAGYTGSWKVEGDAMCFDYGQGPACWQVGHAGEEVVWLRDGEPAGAGRIERGNVRGF